MDKKACFLLSVTIRPCRTVKSYVYGEDAAQAAFLKAGSDPATLFASVKPIVAQEPT